ncbi:MAG: flagellar biosynthetic protein FliO [Bryobacteraceae bacterium]|jgi:flagellar biogenesis protein FliO
MDVLRQVFSVLLVFSLLGAVLWGLRRGGKVSFRRVFAGTRSQGHTRSMVALERLSLTPQHTLHMLRVNGREVLIATHPQGCTVISGEAAERAMGAEA